MESREINPKRPRERSPDRHRHSRRRRSPSPIRRHSPSSNHSRESHRERTGSKERRSSRRSKDRSSRSHRHSRDYHLSKDDARENTCRDRSRDMSEDRSRRDIRDDRRNRSRHSESRDEKSVRASSHENERSPRRKELPIFTEKHIKKQETVVESRPKSPDPEVEKQSALRDAEEKIRQRKERIEQWRKEKALKEAEENLKPDNQNTNNMEADIQQAKAWTLEDEDDDEFIPDTVDDNATADISNFPAHLKPLNSKKDLFDGFVKPKPVVRTPRPIFKKSSQFGHIKITPTSISKPIEQVISRNNAVSQLFSASDEIDDNLQDVYSQKKTAQAERIEKGISRMDENKNLADPFDSFMETVQSEIELEYNTPRNKNADDAVLADMLEDVGPIEEEELEEEKVENPDEMIAAAAALIATKRKEILSVDHESMHYEPFRKAFYIEPLEITQMEQSEVDEKRRKMGNIKIRGSNCPRPVEKWTHFGLPASVLDVIRKSLKYDKPSPIQSQAIPAIMSGRDVIGIAKTGSGKTIAFLLPLFRHIKDQPPIELNDGPIAIIMTPTRELAVQIHRECKHFIKQLNIRATCCYGGAPIKTQIADLKKGSEIVICTPGRLIDLLCAQSGRVLNLTRVTFIVLDEADRMFDMGFEPQVMKVVNNIRPDRQTVLFSATFPKKMEALARKILDKPVEIIIGGRSVVCGDVKQVVEIRDEDSKFVRLLEILGNTFEEDEGSKILVFVDRQEAADTLLGQLLKRGYPCATLHGGKDQNDRDSTIADFKSGDTNILIATSVAARGLDVKKLKVVVNYEVPNHMEDYVHRVGRTGRAGNKGTAYTFITPDQDRFAADIIKALTMSHVDVPEDLEKLSLQFLDKVRLGAATFSSSGFGGKGLEKLDKEREVVKRIQKKSHAFEYAEEEEDPVLDEERKKIEAEFDQKVMAGTADTTAVVALANIPGPAGQANAKLNQHKLSLGLTGLAKAREIIAGFQSKITGEGKVGGTSAFAYEIEINDYPQRARWAVTSKEQITLICEMSGAAITTRGSYFPPGVFVTPGKRKLFLYIEGDSQSVVDKAKAEVKRIITEAIITSMETDALVATNNRYSVI